MHREYFETRFWVSVDDIRHFEVFEEKNNKEFFQRFLVGLKAKCKDKRAVVILDNLKIHHAKILDDVYDEEFKELFLPPYTSPLNPIEHLWSVLKRKWAKDLYHFTEELQAIRGARSVTKKTNARLKEMMCKI